MKLNYRKKSNDSKSNFYLHPYTSSISHEPPSSAQNMDQSRSRSHSNLTDINLSEVQVNSTSSSGHGHNGTLSRLARFLWKNPKKMPHSSSSQNVSNGENKEFKHLISSPGQLSHVPLIQCPKTSNFKMDAETREELRKKLSQLTTQERIQLQQKGLELLKAKINSEIDEKKNFDKTISEIKNHLTTKRQQFRSHTDIENLRNEIRNLTNEKAALELKIIQSTNWTCSNCTYQNPYNTSHCGICNRERQLNEFILCKYCSHKNSLSSLSCMSCTSQLLDINNEESQRTRQSSNSSSCSSVRVNSVQSNVQNGNARLPVYAQCQANYTSQSSSSSNLSVFLDNPVYFNLSSSNLNEMGDARIPPRSPQVLPGQFQDPLQQRPSIPVILDDHSKCKFKKKFF